MYGNLAIYFQEYYLFLNPSNPNAWLHTASILVVLHNKTLSHHIFNLSCNPADLGSDFLRRKLENRIHFGILMTSGTFNTLFWQLALQFTLNLISHKNKLETYQMNYCSCCDKIFRYAFLAKDLEIGAFAHLLLQILVLCTRTKSEKNPQFDIKEEKSLVKNKILVTDTIFSVRLYEN